MKQIMVATDGSDSAQRAIAMAAALCAVLDAELVLLVVGELNASSDIIRFAEIEHATIGTAIEGLCDAVLEEARRIAEKSGATRIRLMNKRGDPAREILGLIRELKPYMAIVGRRGRRTLEALLLGSVSHKLVSLAPCPIIVVP